MRSIDHRQTSGPRRVRGGARRLVVRGDIAQTANVRMVDAEAAEDLLRKLRLVLPFDHEGELYGQRRPGAHHGFGHSLRSRGGRNAHGDVQQIGGGGEVEGDASAQDGRVVLADESAHDPRPRHHLRDHLQPLAPLLVAHAVKKPVQQPLCRVRILAERRHRPHPHDHQGHEPEIQHEEPALLAVSAQPLHGLRGLALRDHGDIGAGLEEVHDEELRERRAGGLLHPVLEVHRTADRETRRVDGVPGVLAPADLRADAPRARAAADQGISALEDIVRLLLARRPEALELLELQAGVVALELPAGPCVRLLHKVEEALALRRDAQVLLELVRQRPRAPPPLRGIAGGAAVQAQAPHGLR
mmetsp:Transcript_102810/g.286352  ORF Transcript_102810/g.286352 Transcript_102810/m.286352 type:complete len:358 (+) Transcript_102810:107-1180(+)